MGLQQVLKKAAVQPDGLARGLREAVKALDRKVAHLCILAQDCDSAEYVRLVGALAQEHSIPIIKVPDGKQLGEWVGLCKLDREGRPRRSSSARVQSSRTMARALRRRPSFRTTSASKLKHVLLYMRYVCNVLKHVHQQASLSKLAC